jgi:hyperosmotically inducible protein
MCYNPLNFLVENLMRNYVFGLMLATCVLLLGGCQSDTFGEMFTPTPSGLSLSQSVQEALMNTGDPVLAQVRVDTNQNTVTLSGYVKKIRQSDTAEQIASQVPGVQTVENHLIVRQ